MEKLDSFSKILIATGQINYMASVIDGVNEQIKIATGRKDVILNEGIEERDALLNETVNKLGDIMEDLGNYMSNTDCLSPIDVRVTNVPFEIIIHGKDNVEE